MPRTKRRFADDDPPTDESSEDPPDEYVVQRGAGKQLRMMGGKHLARPPPAASEEEDSDSSSDEDEAPALSYRSGGKQFRPSGGKQLRVAEPDSDSEEDEDEEEEEDHAPVHRGGGKSLMRMQNRGGGKQLRPMVEEDDEEESDSDESEQEAPQTRPTPTPPSFGGGKQLRRPPPSRSESEDDDDDDDDAMDVDSDEDEEDDKPQVTAYPGGGKMLRRPMGGKQLRPPPFPEPAKEEEAPPKPKAAAKPPPKKAEPQDMEESSDESSDEERELDMETLDPQELVQGEEDQKYLESLAEFEREAILGERFEKLKNAADMKRALRESKRKEREERKAAKEKTSTGKKKAAAKAPAKKATKKKVPDTSGDAELAAKLSSARESQRNRDAKGTKSKKAAALAAFREGRKSLKERKEEEEEEELDFGTDDDEDDSDDDYEEKALKPWQQKKKTATRSSRQVSKYDSKSSSDYSSEEEAADASSGAKKALTGPEAELADYIKITIPRRRLAQWCNEPYFEQVVLNCFVRLGVGEANGKKCYRLCEIIGVVPSKSEYKFPALNKSSKPISTNKALRLRIGKNEKEFPMFLISDSRPTDEDMRTYVEIQKSHRKDVLSKRQAKKLRKNLDEVVHNYQYTNEDIERAVEARKKRGKGLANIGLEQTRIKIAVQAARNGVEEAQRKLNDAKKTLIEFSGQETEADGLEKNVESAQAELEDAKKILEERLQEEERVKTLAKDRKRRLAKRSKDRDWAKVNERAAMVNQTADFESYKAEREKQKSGAGGAAKFNPYARRKVKPKMLWEVGQTKKTNDANGQSGNKETRDEAANKDEPKTTMTLQNNSVRDENDKNGRLDEPVGPQKADLVGESHQFAIDEEVLAQSNGSSLGMFGLSSTKPKIARVRKGLSFQEYKERKAAGTL